MVVTNDPEFKNQPYVKFGEADDQYRGTEPQIEFDKRIKELLDLHSHAVKALRYPDNANPEVETIEEQRKREQEVCEFFLKIFVDRLNGETSPLGQNL